MVQVFVFVNPKFQIGKVNYFNSFSFSIKKPFRPLIAHFWVRLCKSVIFVTLCTIIKQSSLFVSRVQTVRTLSLCTVCTVNTNRKSAFIAIFCCLVKITLNYTVEERMNILFNIK